MWVGAADGDAEVLRAQRVLDPPDARGAVGGARVLPRPSVDALGARAHEGVASEGFADRIDVHVVETTTG